MGIQGMRGVARRTRWLTALVLPLLLAGCPWDDDDSDGGDDEDPTVDVLPMGFVNHTFAYSTYLEVGEAYPFTIEVFGMLPAWLTMTIDSDGRLMFYGTPTAPFDNTFLLYIHDAEGGIHSFHFRLQVLPTNSLALAGLWDLTVDVFIATGVCEGEEDEPVSTYRVSISQVGSDLSLAGIQGDMANVLHGYIYPAEEQDGQPRIDLHGSLDEDGGVSDIRYLLRVNSTTQVSGTEYWSWDGPAQDCDGQSSLTMVRVP